MTGSTTDSGTINATALRARLRGTLIEPGAPGYDTARGLWNGMIDRQPALIVQCLGVADVIACVNAARDAGVPISIKGGGHNIAGLAVCDGGLMLDMSLMRGVWVDPTARIANVQPGCLLGDVDRETQLHGLAAVLGFISNTGVAGLTLGGGFGYLTRRFGWTSDTVRSFQVVTASGELVRAAENENADLYWGLRGGGGNFGVVTNFEYELFPVGPVITGGAIAWEATDAERILDLYPTIATEAPAELTCALVVRKAPPAPWINPASHGKLVVMAVVCHTGNPTDADAWVARLRECGAPVGDTVGRVPYTAQQSMLDATQPKGRRYYWKSEFLESASRNLLGGVLQHAEALRSPHSGIVLFPVGGALNALPDNHSPAGNRDARVVLNIASSWESADDDAANIAWTRGAWQELRAFSTGGAYINFQTEDELQDRIRAAYGNNYARLVELKAAWDPANLFRANKNIEPTG